MQRIAEEISHRIIRISFTILLTGSGKREETYLQVYD